MNAPRALLLAPMLTTTLLMGCAAGGATHSEKTEDEHDSISSLGGAISRDEVLARAQNWVDWGVMYSQDQSNPYQDGDGHFYRADCSGYVSMAWHLAKKPGGGDFNTTDFGSTNLKTVLGSYGELTAGDALDGVGYGHIVLFDRWVDAAQTQMWIYQESDYGIPAEHVQRGVSWYQDNGFEPIRYVRIDGGGDPPPPPPPPASCGVESDGKLHCDNTPNSAMYASMSTSSNVVNTLRGSNSWFTCWGTGQLHAGGNTTWYYTEGDDNASWGWVPAVDLSTTSDFDADPSAAGLAQCGGGDPPPPPPPSDDPNCDVHDDGKLYCGNSSGAPLHAAPTNGSDVVNYLRSTSSWFTCWKSGDVHAGGNTTSWYFTEGDDNANWGYVPAVDLDTSSDFDANPSAHGLAACP